MSARNPTHGTKVTSDPASKEARVGEAAGLATSDSLAGESVRQGGDYGANNEKANISEQPSYSTTTNTTDTSDARRLDPAVDAEARESQGEWNEASQLNAARGLSKSDERGSSGKTGSSGGAGSGSYGSDDVDVAPTYVDANRLNEENFKPKGDNIKEGGFDSSAPNASFNTDIGGKNDPGRLGLEKEQRRVAEQAAIVGGIGAEGETDKGQYGQLKDESA